MACAPLGKWSSLAHPYSQTTLLMMLMNTMGWTPTNMIPLASVHHLGFIALFKCFHPSCLDPHSYINEGARLWPNFFHISNFVPNRISSLRVLVKEI